jgi:uncharacterized protein involved in exopolysaccharide biosynthesis
VLALGVAYVMLAPRVYQASSRLLVDIGGPDPINEDRTAPGRDSRVVMATQADIVRTPAVAAGAAEIAGFTRDPSFVQRWKQQTGGRVPIDQWAGQQMLGALNVEPKKDTNVLLITANSSDPERAAKIANGFAQSAVNAQFRLRTQPAKAYASWLETRLQGARTEVSAAQNKLSNFVKVSGITNDGNLGSEGSQMAEVATQLSAAQARAAAARQNGFTGAQSLADAERAETVQRLRTQVAERTGTVAKLESVFGPEYPEVKRTRAELNTLQAQLNSETAKSRAAFAAARAAEANAERAAASASESTLRSNFGEQRKRMMSMGTNLAQYSTLKNEFEAAKKNFNDINERLLKMRLQGALPETEVKIVDAASVPMFPSSPRVSFIIAMCLFLGLTIGALLAVLLESLDPRVRSAAALERLLGLRVIGHVNMPHALSHTPLLAGPQA